MGLGDAQRERNSAAGMIGEDASPKNLGWVIQTQGCDKAGRRI